jgi:hypothetical protein
VEDFCTDAIAYLDDQDWIEGYAWFAFYVSVFKHAFCRTGVDGTMIMAAPGARFLLQ